MHELSRRALLVSVVAASGARFIAGAAPPRPTPRRPRPGRRRRSATRTSSSGRATSPPRPSTSSIPAAARRPGEPRFRRLARHPLQIRQAAARPGGGQFPARAVPSRASLQASGGRQRAARRHPRADPLRRQSVRLWPHQGRQHPADQSRFRRLSAALSDQRAARLGRGDRVSRRELFPLSRPRPALWPFGAGSGDRRRLRASTRSSRSFANSGSRRRTPTAEHIVIYALLDGESATGAFRFDLTPGQESFIDANVSLFARKATPALGLAPLSSMYFVGKADRRFTDDFRGELHDSDGLLMHTGAGEWIWRPLSNPAGAERLGLPRRQPARIRALAARPQFQRLRGSRARL